MGLICIPSTNSAIRRKNKKILVEPGFKPRAAGWEAWILPLCYPPPLPRNSWLRNYLDTVYLKRCPGRGANLGSFWFSFIFSHKQCLRPLGYCAPQDTGYLTWWTAPWWPSSRWSWPRPESRRRVLSPTSEGRRRSKKPWGRNPPPGGAPTPSWCSTPSSK